MKLNKSLLFVLITCSALLLGCGFTGQVQAQGDNNDINKPGTPPAQISDNNISKPKIVFEDKLLDFGKIGPETKPTGEFRFTNTGNATLEITGVHQCCGIVASLKNEKSKYEPGEKGAIEITFANSMRSGMFMRQPIVYSNDPIEPNLALTITAEIVDKVSAQPAALKLFLDEDNAKCPKLTIKSTDNQAFSIRDIQSTGNCITVPYDPNVKATEFVLEPKVDMAKLGQNMKGNVDIILTHPDMSILTVPFDVLSKFKVDPPLIIAINAKPGEPVVRKIWVFNNYDQDFEIGSVTSQNNYITVLSQSKLPNDSKGYQFEVRLTPPPPEGKTSFNDELYIQIKNGEKLKINCNGYYPPKMP